jgi:hypothetical protein
MNITLRVEQIKREEALQAIQALPDVEVIHVWERDSEEGSG